jgi:hypothetical protein
MTGCVALTAIVMKQPPNTKMMQLGASVTLVVAIVGTVYTVLSFHSSSIPTDVVISGPGPASFACIGLSIATLISVSLSQPKSAI